MCCDSHSLTPEQRALLSQRDAQLRAYEARMLAEAERRAAALRVIREAEEVVREVTTPVFVGGQNVTPARLGISELTRALVGGNR